MKQPGPLLASGRDSDIFEYSPGLVLRRSRDGRSIAHEARTMDFLRGCDYPVPRIDEISDDGTALVMERIDGPNMVQALGKAPWTVRRQGATLGRLHRQLHEIAAPDFLADAPVGTGDRLLHLDLHPLNVLIGPTGPVVIDWANATRGDPAVDVAVAWVLMSAGEVPSGRILGAILGRGRAVMMKSFISTFEWEPVRARLREVVEWKTKDPHMSDEENRGMWRAVEKAETKGL